MYVISFLKKQLLSIGMFFELHVMLETTMLYILISVWMTLTFIHGHSHKNQKLVCLFGFFFLGKLAVYRIEYVATTCWFVGPMLG